MSNQTPGDPFGSLSDNIDPTGSKRGEPLGLLGDQYVVLEVHRGGMGEVYICKSTSENKSQFALKTFQKRLFFDRASREAFVREVTIWMRLTGQPHIMPALGLEHFNGQLFVLMPAIGPGPNGETTIRDLLEQQGRLSPEEALSFAFQMALGLRSAQKYVPGIVHGDLKPENLLLIGGKLLISDFGLGRIMTELHPEIQFEGTWAYQAPECWGPNTVISPACDIYSFGVVLYEFLMGKTPFHASTREEWSHAHQHKQPYLSTDLLQDGISAVLMTLAQHCLQKKPEDRPQDFAAIFDEIRQLALDYDYVEGFLLLMQSADVNYFFETMRKDLKPSLIASLLDLQMYDLALSELDTTPEELFTSELWRLRGNALSLSGRDEEALSAFEKALQSDLNEDQRYLCLSNAALSLKRLSRFQEAIDIYNKLLVQVPDHMQAQILSNLGTVYLESKQLEEAVRCFQLLTREHPELPEGWGNLGQSYRELGRYEQAVRCFHRALALAPDMAVVQVMLGEVYMDHLGRIEEAAAALELAGDQGYSSYDWFVRFLACNLLLGRNETVAQLAAVARRDLAEAELSGLEAEIQQLIQKITESKPAESQSQAHPMQVPARTEDDDRRKEMMEEVKTPGIPHPKSRSVSRRRRLTQPFRSFGTHVKRLLGLDQKFTMPFLNTRFYLDEGLYSIDFYNDPTILDYVEQFLRAWRQVTRDPRVRDGGNFTLRTTPFYFTICPRCSIPILTNRDHGKTLTCRHCEAIHETCAVKREEFDELLDRLMARLGKQLVDITGHILVLVLVLSTEKQMEMIEDICHRASFDPLPREHPTVLNLLMQAQDRGLQTLTQPYSAWQKVSTVAYRVYADETPPEVEQVLRTIRAKVTEVYSMSTTYDPTDTSPMGLALRGDTEAVEAYLRQELQVDPSSSSTLMGLIEILITRGKFEEAREKALAATQLHGDDAQSWSVLGRIEMRCSRFQEAAEALKKALALNPTDRRSSFLLAHCYQELGDTDKAGVLFARSQGLGGME